MAIFHCYVSSPEGKSPKCWMGNIGSQPGMEVRPGSPACCSCPQRDTLESSILERSKWNHSWQHVFIYIDIMYIIMYIYNIYIHTSEFWSWSFQSFHLPELLIFLTFHRKIAPLIDSGWRLRDRHGNKKNRKRKKVQKWHSQDQCRPVCVRVFIGWDRYIYIYFFFTDRAKHQYHSQKDIGLPSAPCRCFDLDDIAIVRHPFLEGFPQECCMDHVVHFYQKAQGLDVPRM